MRSVKPKPNQDRRSFWDGLASRSEKGGKFITGKVSKMRNRGTLKGFEDDRATTPLKSITWEAVESYSISSVFSSVSTASFKNCSIMKFLGTVIINRLTDYEHADSVPLCS